MANEHQHQHPPPEAVAVKDRATCRAQQSGPWSDLATWANQAPPTAEDDVVYIGPGLTVTFDTDFDGKIIFIDDGGGLIWRPDRDTTLTIENLLAMAHAKVQIGTRTTPITAVATIYIKGNAKRSIMGGPQFEEAAHGLWFWSRAEICGKARSPWCRLIAAAQPGDTVLTVDAPALDWKKDELIVLAAAAEAVGEEEFTRNYPPDERELPDPRQNELFQIERVEGNKIHLTSPVQYPHAGDPATRQQAAVGMLYQNVWIASADPYGEQQPPDSGDYIDRSARGHVVFFNGLNIAHALFLELGINGRLGKYPVHCHLPGEIVEGWKDLESIVVWNSGFHGIVLHQCREFQLRNCFVFNVMGFGYYIELIDTVTAANVDSFADNRFQHCAGGLVKGFLTPSAYGLQQAGLQLRTDAAKPLTKVGHDHPTVFWLANPRQVLQDISAWDAQNGIGVNYVDEWGTGERGGVKGPPELSGDAHHCTQGVYSQYTRAEDTRSGGLQVWRCGRGKYIYGFDTRRQVYADFVDSENSIAAHYVAAQGLWRSDHSLDDIAFGPGKVQGRTLYGGFVAEAGPSKVQGRGFRLYQVDYDTWPYALYFNNPGTNRWMIGRIEECILRGRYPIRMDGQGSCTWQEDSRFYFRACRFPGAPWLEPLGDFLLLPHNIALTGHVPDAWIRNARKADRFKDEERPLEGNWIVPVPQGATVDWPPAAGVLI